MRLGRFLVREGYVREEDVVRALGEQLQIGRYSPEHYPIDQSLAETVPAETAQRYRVVPLHREGRLLTVAMPDPSDMAALDTLGQLTGCEIETVICTERELNQLMSSTYGTAMGLGNILQPEENAEVQPEERGVEDVEVRSLLDLAEGAPAVRMVNWIIAEAVRESASDIHISPDKNYVQIRFRVDGRLREVPAPPRSMLLSVISRIKILASMDIAVSRIPQDGRFTTRIDGKEINIRASTMPTINGENVVLRLLDMSASAYTLDMLGMSEEDRRKMEPFIHRPHGMILSTGPTGSGKSTSLYAILRKLNEPDVNIITVEDPVEYRVERIRQVQLNTKAGMTFASGLRSILRQDPDIIMVGEIRDSETAQIAVQAALTGHMVLSTAHTNDAVGAITRLADMGVEYFLISSVLTVSFAQRLLRRVCPSCRQQFDPPAELLKSWELEGAKDLCVFRADGCSACGSTGYQGRTGIFEVLAVTEDIQRMITSRTPAQEIQRACVQAGILTTLKSDAARKIAQGITTFEEAMSNVSVE